jgi:hypothetical protein
VGAIGVEPQEDFNWGFKVGGTYRLSYDDWKVGVMYSYLKTIVNEPIQAAYGKGFFPSQYANQAVNNYDDGELLARRSFQNLETGSHTVYNDVHFTLERPTLITKDLEVTPFYGIDASFFSRRQTVVFTNDGIHLTPADTKAGIYLSDDGFYYQNYQKIQWWGVGPMIGVHTSWYLAYDVSFYGDAYTALEYGRSSSRTATLSKDYFENANPNEASIENFLYQFSPNYSFQLGLNWTRMLEEFDVRIGFNIGYESTYYSQVIKTLVPEMNYRVQNGSGLGIQGLVLQGTLDF